MGSVWSDSVSLKKRRALNNDIISEVVVIGAGIAGILTAFMLKQAGMEVIVLEANEVLSGNTKNTTAKITSQHGLIYDSLIKQFGIKKAKQYLDANQLAIKKFEEIVYENEIECNFEKMNSYVYSLEDGKQIQKEVEAVVSLGMDAKFEKEIELPFDIKGAIKFPNQAQYNPLKFLSPLADQLDIFEYTQVRDINGETISTKNYKIRAKHIVVATHYPFINIPGYYFLRIHQERSYLLALENAQKLNGYYVDAQTDGLTFRNYENLMIMGGADHRTGKNDSGGRYEHIRRIAKHWYPTSVEKYHWSAQDCMSQDSVPFIGQYSSSTPNLYVATGFNKWGMSSAMVSAMILSDMILGHNNENSEIFSPQRFNIDASAKNIAKDSFNIVSGLIKQAVKLPVEHIDKIRPGFAGEVEYDGLKCGVYKDPKGLIYIVDLKCPHMGCHLKWNQDELSWDCPCHGSRFNYEGKLIDNPALGDIKLD